MSLARVRVTALRALRARLLSGTRSSAPSATDEQIAEINREIAEFFGNSSESPPSSSAANVHHAEGVQRRHSEEPRSLQKQPWLDPQDAIQRAATRAADEATIAQLRERVLFLERLVERLVGKEPR